MKKYFSCLPFSKYFSFVQFARKKMCHLQNKLHLCAIYKKINSVPFAKKNCCAIYKFQFCGICKKTVLWYLQEELQFCPIYIQTSVLSHSQKKLQFCTICTIFNSIASCHIYVGFSYLFPLYTPMLPPGVNFKKKLLGPQNTRFPHFKKEGMTFL